MKSQALKNLVKRLRPYSLPVYVRTMRERRINSVNVKRSREADDSQREARK